MIELLVTVVASFLGIIVILLAAFVIGMRAKSRVALAAVRRISRIFNPLQMKSAGKPGAFASIIRHTGRASGRAYATPVGAIASEGGFIVSLPYGTRAHWVRNVLAAGSATLVSEGADLPGRSPRDRPARVRREALLAGGPEGAPTLQRRSGPAAPRRRPSRQCRGGRRRSDHPGSGRRQDRRSAGPQRPLEWRAGGAGAPGFRTRVSRPPTES